MLPGSSREGQRKGSRVCQLRSDLLNLDVSQARKRGHREGMVEGKNAEVGCDVGAVRGESQKGRKLKAEVGFFHGVFLGWGHFLWGSGCGRRRRHLQMQSVLPQLSAALSWHGCPPCRVLVLLPLYLTCKRTSLCLLEPLSRMLLGVYLPQGFL